MTPDRKLALVGAVTFLVTGALAADGLVRGEVAATELVNALPGVIVDALEVVMQLGTTPAIFLVAAITIVVSDTDWRRALVAVILAGGLSWAASHVAKDVVERPRPAAYTNELVIRSGASGHGWPSTHVSTATGTLVSAALVARRRPTAAVGLAGVVGLGRMAVGVHLPLDVLGGLGLGVAIAVVVVEIADR